MSPKRVFIIVLDSAGCGEMPDAPQYGDAGSNTLAACAKSSRFFVPHLESLGLFNIDKIGCGVPRAAPLASFGRLAEASKGKDTTIGHWEIAGIVSPKPLPTFPDGFPTALLDEYSRRVGRGILCNKPYSGTQVIADYGPRHLATGDLIVYTSADSVFQVAAHEGVVPLQELYRGCEIARGLLTGEWGVGRVIARPFAGEAPNFIRTANRHDYSLPPPGVTVLDNIRKAGLDCIGVGKIYDIFAGRGISEYVRTLSNDDGMQKTIACAGRDFHGLCFVNLVDFDMIFGHRNDVDGYAGALSAFDVRLGELLPLLREEDLLLITADHGCDPSTPGTDHSREYVPLLAFGRRFRQGVNLGTGETFADIAATVADYLEAEAPAAGRSLLERILL